MNFHCQALCLVAALCSDACTDLTPPGATPPPDGGPIVTVSGTAYHWTTDSAIAVTIRNPSGASTFIACIPYHLQRYRNRWIDVPQPSVGFIDGECHYGQITSMDTVRYSVPLTNDYVPIAAWYRVVAHLYHDGAVGPPWGEANRVSAPFHVAP